MKPSQYQQDFAKVPYRAHLRSEHNRRYGGGLSITSTQPQRGGSLYQSVELGRVVRVFRESLCRSNVPGDETAFGACMAWTLDALAALEQLANEAASADVDAANRNEREGTAYSFAEANEDAGVGDVDAGGHGDEPEGFEASEDEEA